MTESIAFILFCLFFWIIPGNLILRLLKIKDSPLFNFLLSTILGIAVFFYISIIIRVLNLPFILLTYLIYSTAFIFYLAKFNKEIFKTKLKFKPSKNTIAFLLISITSIYLLTAMHLNSEYKDGKYYASAARDALWRISIAEELKYHFPPNHPGHAFTPLKNYHYFYDFLIASSGLLTDISSPSLYYYYFSILSATVFTLSTNLIIRLFAKSNLFRHIGVFLVIFTGNLSFLLPFISSQYDFVIRNNIFMSDQPFDQGYNPFNLLTYGMFLFIIYLLYKWEEKPSYKIVIIFSLILGFIPGIKIYAGLILYASLGFIILRLILKRSIYGLLFSLPYLIFLPLFSLIRGPSSTTLIFKPFWLLERMISDYDRVNIKFLDVRGQIYKSTNNYLRLAVLSIIELAIYIIGNLNTRLLSLPWIVGQIKNIKKLTLTNQFIITSILISISIPLLFIQSRGAYDIMQFTPYGLILLSLVSIPTIERLVYKIADKNKIVGLLTGAAIIILSTFTSVYLAFERSGYIPEYIESDELEAIEYLKSATTPDDVILSDLIGGKSRLMFIPALSGRRVYLSAPDLVDQTGIDPKEREKTVRTLEKMVLVKNDPLLLKELLYENSLKNIPVEIIEIPSNEYVIALYDPKLKQEAQKYISKNINPQVNYIYLSQTGLGASEVLSKLDYELVYSNNTVNIFKL